MSPELAKLEKMLTALLRNNDQLHWIGGYVHGRTNGDDPFIILYPASERLNHKVCRVYPHDFKKLPPFIDTQVPEGITQEGNPDKDKALKKGLYHETPSFLIVTYQGKETQMGNEIRFSDVLHYPSENTSNEHQAYTTPSRPAPRPPVQPQTARLATPQPPISPTSPSPTPLPTEREHYFTYATGLAGLSQGAATVHLESFGGSYLDALQALQAERGERPTPAPREEADATKYYAFTLKTLGWSRDGAKALLDQYHGDFTAAYHHAKAKQPA